LVIFSEGYLSRMARTNLCLTARAILLMEG
jgi:hypothetical protein